MNNKVKCIMLIDDSADDNFLHERLIKKCDAAETVITMQRATDALDYLRSKVNDAEPPPDLIFLDVNMPGMNGWEFLTEYNKLDLKFRSEEIIVMLTTSENPDDLEKSKLLNGITEFRSKPLTKEILQEILDRYFSKLRVSSGDVIKL